MRELKRSLFAIAAVAFLPWLGCMAVAEPHVPTTADVERGVSGYWCPATGVSYGVTLYPAEHFVHVDAVTHQPVTEFQFPVWNALYQVRDFAVNVSDVKAYDGVPEWMCDKCATRDASASKRDKTTWEIAGSGNHPCLTFSYDVAVNDPGAFGSSLDAQHGFFNWAEVLVYRPEQREQAVSLRIFQIPTAWKLRDGGVGRPRATDDPSSAQINAANYDRLVDSPAMLGKLYEREFQQDGGSYRIVVDSSEVNLDVLERMLRKITAATVDWMQDRPFENYTFMFFAEHGSGTGGMEHANSSVIDIGGEALNTESVNTADYACHEFFHLWNVKRIRPRSLEPIDYAHEQYSRALWFSEGVTSTVTDFIEMRIGLLDQQQWLSHVGALITSLQSRRARLSQSVEDSSVETWLEVRPAYHRSERSISYYAKGELLGLLIDLRMRQLTGGRRCLRDLFQYMNEHYAKAGTYFDDSEGVREALQELTGDDFRDFFQRYVSGVDEIPYDRFFSYVGLRLNHRKVQQIHAGFSASNSPGGPPTIVRVDDSGTAPLNLLPGDVILSVNGQTFSGDWDQFLQRQNPKGHLRMKVRSRRGEVLLVTVPLSTRTIDQYRLTDVPGITVEVLERRKCFMRGEAEVVAP